MNLDSAQWALVVAAGSLVISVVSMGWQVVTWRYSRGLVRVTASALPGGSIQVRAFNRGSLPAFIVSAECGEKPWWVRVMVGSPLTFPTLSGISADGPIRVEAGGMAEFVVAPTTAGRHRVHVDVGLGTGAWVRTNTVRLSLADQARTDGCDGVART